MIIFGIVLACHLFIEQFNFNDYWFLFLVIPALADIILNKINSFNMSLLILSTALLGYFIFDNFIVSIIILVISIGMSLVFSRFLVKEENDDKISK